MGRAARAGEEVLIVPGLVKVVEGQGCEVVEQRQEPPVGQVDEPQDAAPPRVDFRTGPRHQSSVAVKQRRMQAGARSLARRGALLRPPLKANLLSENATALAAFSCPNDRLTVYAGSIVIAVADVVAAVVAGERRRERNRR